MDKGEIIDEKVETCLSRQSVKDTSYVWGKYSKK